MPMYEYKCPECFMLREILMNMAEAEDCMPLCPKCLNVMNRVPSVSVLQFKGSGFYVNDYKKEGK